MSLDNNGSRHLLLHTDHIHCCDHCEPITLSKEDTKGWNFMLQIPHTRKEARAAAKDGCPLFQLFVEAFTQGTALRSLLIAISSLLPFTQTKCGIPQPLVKWWYEDKSAVRAYLSRVAYVFRHLRRRHLYLTFSGPVVKVHYLMWANLSKGLVVTSSHGDAATEFAKDRPVNPCVSSEDSFMLARRWLMQCHASHTKCQLRPSVFVPRRLLRIDLHNSLAIVRLIETSHGDILRWCTLSYVWGGDQSLKLTISSSAMLKRGISVEKLPQTLQDAVFVSRKLEVDHLWIDCLCIIQDDPKDLERELTDVPEIYQRSFATISASSAKSVHEGFLHDRGYFFNSIPPMKIQYRSSERKVGALLLFESHFSGVDDPIDTRAWTYQERLLSPRLLQYTTTGLQWKCRTCQDADGGPYISMTFADNEGIETPREIPCLEGRPMMQWRRVVCEYTSRNLTYPGDKLPAISAVAEIYRRSTEQTYLAGLWKECLPQDLCWRVSDRSSLSRRPRAYRAPSWSWAAVDGRILPWLYEFGLDAFQVQNDAELLNASVSQTPAKTTSGIVSAGSIVIKGRMWDLDWYYNRTELSLNGEEVDGFPDAKEDDCSSAPEAHIRATACLILISRSSWRDCPPIIRRCGLILTECYPGTYRRIGFFQCKVEGHKDCTNTLAGSKIRTISII